MIKNTLLLEALEGKQIKRAPVWLMRQAGRYLPEYQKMRKEHPLGRLFREPLLAAEVTLLPLKRFPLDAAIVFSDLLVLLEVFGVSVSYPEEGGLEIFPVVTTKLLPKVCFEDVEKKLAYVFSTIKLVKPELTVPLLGFVGAPFTLLCYLIEGKGGSYEQIKKFIRTQRERALALLDQIVEVVIWHAQLQIEAGADVIQLFDSWAHILTEEEFSLFVVPYLEQILQKVKDAPLIFFSRNNSSHIEKIASLSPAGISFEEGITLKELRRRVPSHVAIQGNYDPKALLYHSKEQIYNEAKQMASSVYQERGVIFNLGHGVLPGTPVAHVEAFLEGVQAAL